jgi:hypothetical protein
MVLTMARATTWPTPALLISAVEPPLNARKPNIRMKPPSEANFKNKKNLRNFMRKIQIFILLNKNFII